MRKGDPGLAFKAGSQENNLDGIKFLYIQKKMESTLSIFLIVLKYSYQSLLIFMFLNQTSSP